MLSHLRRQFVEGLLGVEDAAGVAAEQRAKMYASFLRDLLFVVRFKPHFLETVADGCDNKRDLAGFFGQHFDKVEQLLPAAFAEICLAVLGEMLDIIRQQFAVPVAQMFFSAFHALHVLGAFFFCGLFFAVLALVPVGKVLAGIEVAVDDTKPGVRHGEGGPVLPAQPPGAEVFACGD